MYDFITFLQVNERGPAWQPMVFSEILIINSMGGILHWLKKGDLSSSTIDGKNSIMEEYLKSIMSY